MANYASQLYSMAKKMAAEGNSPAERAVNARKADIWLMEAVSSIGGKNFDRQIALAKERLGQFESRINAAVEAGSSDDIYASGSEVKQRSNNRITINSAADLTEDLVGAFAEGTFGANTPSLLEDRFQGMRMTNVLDRTNDQIGETLKSYQNAMENLANATDFRNVPLEQRQAILDSDTVKNYMSQVSEYENMFGSLQDTGLDLGVPTLTRDKNGNYTSTAGEGLRNTTVGRSGEPVDRRINEDGTIDIYGTRSNTVLRTLPAGTSDQEIVRSMTELQAGFASTAAETAAGTASGGSSATSITGSDSADAVLTGVEGAFNELLAEAEAQGIEITDEIRQQYLQQAWAGQSTYYSELIRNAEFDLGTSLTRLVEDTRASEAEYIDTYKKNLTATQGDLQNRGMLYGGVRSKAERTIADDTNRSLDALDTTLSRGLADFGSAFERSLGSGGASDYADAPGTAAYATTYGSTLGTTPSVGRVLAGTPTFETGEETSLFQPQGGGTQFGDINRDIQVSTETEANGYETAERDRFSQFA